MHLPVNFVDRTKPQLNDEWTNFLSALQEPAPTSIRLNRKKTPAEPNLEAIPWCSSGYYLPNRPQFTFDPLFHAGSYYVQEASSMFIECAIKQLIEGDICSLDLCAAPGGKSTLTSSLLSDNSLLVSNEIVKSRAYILAENMMKWGNSNCIVSNNKPSDFKKLSNFFDLIVVDAPCSGEGMFRKDPKSIDEWSVSNVSMCAQRQKEILSDIWDCIKTDGYLFYSTCTYNREENEDIVEWLCTEYDAEVVSLQIEEQWGITPSAVEGGNTYHFYPHKTKGEGFFFAAIRKIDSSNSKTPKTKNIKINRSKFVTDSIKEYLIGNDNLFFFEKNNFLYAFPDNRLDELALLEETLNIFHRGVCIGEIKGKDLIPNQSLALSNILNREAFNQIDIDWKTAISYLKKESLSDIDTAKGYVLLTYKNSPIGFVKNVGNRANNLYPQEWRIRSNGLPDNFSSII